MVTRIMLVAGEPSGDDIGGRLMAALTERVSGSVHFAGVGGMRMTAEGLESLFPMSELSVMGFAEVVPRLPRLLKRVEDAAALALGIRPHALITIDSPGFNFRLGRRLKGRGIPLIHYVAPQVWAWRAGRARKMATVFDHLMTLLPFEPPYFETEGLPATFVGHPVVEVIPDASEGRAFRERHSISWEATLLAVLPGSRQSEIARLLPVFCDSVLHVAARLDRLHIVVPVLPDHGETLRRNIAVGTLPVTLVTRPDERRAALAAADGALAASGTIALELALAGVPMVIAYRVHPLTAMLARRLIKVDQACLVNILLGKAIVPELLQQDCQPERLAEAVHEILTDQDIREQHISAGRAVAAQLVAGATVPSQRAAEVVLRVAADGPRKR